MSPSYHDATVWINGHKFEMHALPFNVAIVCTRVGGWELRDMEADREIAGEYAGKERGHFCITVHGHPVVGDPAKIPNPPIGERPKLKGWTGMVVNTAKPPTAGEKE